MILGLTGFSGTGKSTVASLLSTRGFYVLDCDKLVHEQVYQDPAVIAAMRHAFGEQVLENGKLNRKALRASTLGDRKETQKLNDTMMPYILRHIEAEIRRHAGEPIVLDAPLLFESGLNQRCDRVVSVISSRENAIKRIMERDGLTEEEAKRRLASQHPASYYTAQSDYVIQNDEGFFEVEAKTLKIIDEIHEQFIDETL